MKDLLKAIFNIFKGLWSILTFFRSLFFNVLFIGIILLVVLSFIKKDEAAIEPDSLLQLSIYGNIVEQKQETTPFDHSLEDFFGISPQSDETLLQDLLDCIHAASSDPKITGILLDMTYMGSAGMNQLQDIGNALNRFKKHGKIVVAAEDYYNQDQYFLAAHADKIFLNSMGFVHLSGFGLYRLYFQEALEKLKINYHVFRVGSYKSALEPFMRNSMSPEDRQQSRTWLSALWQSYVATVSRQRSIETTDILGYINDIPDNLEKTGGDLSKLAQKTGLVDEVATRQQIRNYLGSISKRLPDGNYRSVHFDDYLSTVKRSYRDYEDDNNIAIIVAQGTILPGPSGPGTIGSDTIVDLIREASHSPEIKAVVIRIDSGGGSAFASEIIRQELIELRKKNKPIVISMGAVAASGAYWLSADADEIWASNDSITGSIGIFMALPTFEDMLSHAGVYRDGVGTTNLSGALDVTKPLSPEIKKAIQLSLEHGYQTFLSIVSEGRDIPLDTMKKIAQGKVYTGSAATELGLVDKIGTLEEAIASAAEMAGITTFSATILAPPLSFQEIIFQNFNTSLTNIVAAYFPFGRSLLEYFRNDALIPLTETRKDPNGLYAHCMVSY